MVMRLRMKTHTMSMGKSQNGKGIQKRYVLKEELHQGNANIEAIPNFSFFTFLIDLLDVHKTRNTGT